MVGDDVDVKSVTCRAADTWPHRAASTATVLRRTADDTDPRAVVVASADNC